MSGIDSKAIIVLFNNNIFRVGLDTVIVLLYFLRRGLSARLAAAFAFLTLRRLISISTNQLVSPLY